MVELSLVILGLVLLLAGGTGLVRGASAIAEQYGVSPLVIGLTVVAFGTSAPELVVNLIGAVRGETDIAFGNITGSNIANLGLVLGSAALLSPLAIEGQIIRRELPLLMLGTLALLVMTLDPVLRNEPATLDRADGIILLLLFGIFLYITIADFLLQEEDPLLASIDEIAPSIATHQFTPWINTVAGVIGLAIGGQLVITNGVGLAEMLGVSATVIGIAVVAVGTSMPELVTSIIAAMRKEADLCVGNVIGSNIFNCLLVLPLSAIVHPLALPYGGNLDIMVSLLLASTLIPVFILGKASMPRNIGVIFLAVYFGYLAFRIFVLN